MLSLENELQVTTKNTKLVQFITGLFRLGFIVCVASPHLQYHWKNVILTINKKHYSNIFHQKMWNCQSKFVAIHKSQNELTYVIYLKLKKLSKVGWYSSINWKRDCKGEERKGYEKCISNPATYHMPSQTQRKYAMKHWHRYINTGYNLEKWYNKK